MLRKKIVPTTTVSRVRFRSTMCVPPCEAGVAGFLTKDRLGTQLVDAILELGSG